MIYWIIGGGFLFFLLIFFLLIRSRNYRKNRNINHYEKARDDLSDVDIEEDEDDSENEETISSKTKNFIPGIIGLTIGVVIFANVFTAVKKDINTSLFGENEKIMWNLLTLVGIVGLVYALLTVFGLTRS